MGKKQQKVDLHSTITTESIAKVIKFVEKIEDGKYKFNKTILQANLCCLTIEQDEIIIVQRQFESENGSFYWKKQAYFLLCDFIDWYNRTICNPQKSQPNFKKLENPEFKERLLNLLSLNDTFDEEEDWGGDFSSKELSQEEMVEAIIELFKKQF